MNESEIEAAIEGVLEDFTTRHGGLTFLGNTEKSAELVAALVTALADAVTP